MVTMRKTTDRERILDEKLVREDVEGARQLSEAARGDPHIQHSSDFGNNDYLYVICFFPIAI